MLSTTELVKENAQLKQRISLLEEMLRTQRHKDYGGSSEKDTHQSQLFNEAEEEDAKITVPAHTCKKRKRASIIRTLASRRYHQRSQ